MKKAAEDRGEARIVNHSAVVRLSFPLKHLQEKYLEKRGGNLGGDGAGLMPPMIPGPNFIRYAQSKIANCAFTSCLHHHFKASNINVKAMVAHPGLSATRIIDNTILNNGLTNFRAYILMKPMEVMMQSGEDGAIGILMCMTDANVQSGDFVGPGSGMLSFKGRVVTFPMESFYDNSQTQNMLWDKSCEAVDQTFVINLPPKKAA